MTAPAPHYVTTAQGQLRLWLAGPAAGPALMALACPTVAARALAGRLAGLLPGWRVVAAELPGVGGSARVAPDAAVPALAQALGWLGPEPAALLGFGLGAAFAPALAGALPRRPARVLGVGAERLRGWAAAGTAPGDLAPRADGTHLGALWAFLRDRHLLDPAGPRLAAREGEPLPDDAALSEAFVAAAVDPAAFARLWAIAMASAGDAGAAAGPALLAGLPAALAGLALPPCAAVPPPTAALPGAAIWHDYADTARGRLHLRRAGAEGAPLLVIPTGGGSSAQFAPVISGLARGRQVFAVDYPGNGLSDPPQGPVSIAGLAQDMLALLDAMGIARADVWGSHTGALVGLELAVIAPQRVGRLAMEGPVFISPDFRDDLLANYFPRIAPDRWGLHLPLVWNWRRDLFLYWPWYRVERAAARGLGLPTPEELHLYAVGILESGETYDGAYRAAFSYDTRARLPRLTRPALVCAGPNDMLKDGLAEARRIGSAGPLEVTETPTTVWWPDPDPAEAARTLALYDRFLRGAPG